MDLQPPHADQVDGYLVVLEGTPRTALVIGPSVDGLPARVLHQNEMVLKYGLVFLYEPEDSLIVQFAMDDFQRQYHGIAAINFALRRGDAFPRGDLFGHRTSNGEYFEAFIREIDLASGLRAYVFSQVDDHIPIARIDLAVWVDEDVKGLINLPPEDERPPDLLGRAVPCLCVNLASLPKLPRLLDNILPA
jgi:hypothetical protein